MKLKNFFLGTLLVNMAGASLFFAYIFKQGKEFETTLKKTPESLDEVVLCGGKHKLYNGKEMTDLKIGAFMGAMALDFTDVITKDEPYKMDVTIKNAIITVAIPDNFNVNLIDSCHFGAIANTSVCKDPKNAVNLFVSATITRGALNFENPK